MEAESRGELRGSDLRETILDTDHLDFLMKVDHMKGRYAHNEPAKAMRMKRILLEEEPTVIDLEPASALLSTVDAYEDASTEHINGHTYENTTIDQHNKTKLLEEETTTNSSESTGLVIDESTRALTDLTRSDTSVAIKDMHSPLHNDNDNDIDS